MKKPFLIALVALLLSGCTVRLVDLTIASTKNYNLKEATLVKGPRVSGEDMVSVIVFPLGLPDIKKAMDQALEKNKCAVALTDVVVTQLNHAFIFGSFGYRVDGTAVIDKGRPGCESVTP